MKPVKVQITYCAVWHYGSRAASLAENLLVKWPSEINSLTLIPSDGGVYEVEVDGRLIYSKKATGRHAEGGEVEALFEKAIRK